MQVLLLVLVLCALAVSGCASKRPISSPPATAEATQSRKPDGGKKPIVTPDTSLNGKVINVNLTGRFVVLNFPPGRMPQAEQHLNLYRNGLKVGEVSVSGPQYDDDIVADLIAGQAQAGDAVSDK